jgi:hypothetical protein
MMHLVLTSGGGGDPAGPSLLLVLQCALVLVLAAVLMMIPILVARHRGASGADSILAGAVLWGVVTALYAGNVVVTRFNRAQEHMNLLMQGYDDPAGSGDGAGRPWGWWVALAGFYLVLLAVALVSKRRGPDGPAQQG